VNLPEKSKKSDTEIRGEQRAVPRLRRALAAVPSAVPPRGGQGRQPEVGAEGSPSGVHSRRA